MTTNWTIAPSASSIADKKVQIRSPIIETGQTRSGRTDRKFQRQHLRKLLKMRWWRRLRRYTSPVLLPCQAPNRPRKRGSSRLRRSNNYNKKVSPRYPKELLSICAQTRVKLSNKSLKESSWTNKFLQWGWACISNRIRLSTSRRAPRLAIWPKTSLILWQEAMATLSTRDPLPL